MRLGSRSVFVACLSAVSLTAAEPPKSFEKNVQPVIAKSCLPCHNDRMASGGLNLGPLPSAASITEQRDEWERILQKIRTGEMPPQGHPEAAATADRGSDAVRRGRVREGRPQREARSRPRHRAPLNRDEYSNTIRDLLAVDFRAEKDFPTDDSGHGFDNIGDVLTISPVLMEKYIERGRADRRPRDRRRSAAEEAARSRVSRSRDKTIRRLDRSAPSRLRTASSGTREYVDPHRPAGPARRGRQAGDAGLLDGRQATAHRCRSKQSRRSWCTSIRTRKRSSALLPAGRRPRVPRRLHRRRVRQEAVGEGSLQRQEEQVPRT